MLPQTLPPILPLQTASGYNLDPIPDLAADFGPDIPEEGVGGLLRVGTTGAVGAAFRHWASEAVWGARSHHIFAHLRCLPWSRVGGGHHNHLHRKQPHV